MSYTSPEYTCPKCGQFKSSYLTYCNDCNDAAKKSEKNKKKWTKIGAGIGLMAIGVLLTPVTGGASAAVGVAGFALCADEAADSIENSD
eukprot:CAMPEP_0202692284 /NCGR_PEP_ID=MMETSP1385-20130828/6699_1 /ASSEMBLY_ACC=CAM_ASM_000861 /TAXON_ID=933848 /ORGANISM="Elphidium margaritaceum" /LENGTH=88 /DNA_ID=CAMNT_0049347781 /DNA_START=100 /DNA_END=366 /DNA_ORIENTATION=+